MTIYGSFHLAQVDGALGVCMHPISLLSSPPAEIITPFATEKDAEAFVEALIEAQNEQLIELGGEPLDPEAEDEDDAGLLA